MDRWSLNWFRSGCDCLCGELDASMMLNDKKLIKSLVNAEFPLAGVLLSSLTVFVLDNNIWVTLSYTSHRLCSASVFMHTQSLC